MAQGRGYLGKISAVVAANTGNYVRGLNESAKATKSFASQVQGELRKASSEASKSINAIFTPLQRYERAIQAAASQKLAFRGFDGAIDSVEKLYAVISKFNGRQSELNFVVSRSGLRNITEVNEIIGGLKQRQIDLAVRVGGVEGLRRLRADVSEVNGKTVNVQTNVDATELDDLIAKFSRISPERLKRLQIAVETRQLQQAITQSDRLVSISKELAEPLAAATQQYAALSSEIQTAFGPAFQKAQRGVENLTTAAEAGARITSERYAGVTRAVEATTAAISRLTEAQRLAGSGLTGRELAFVNPRTQDELTRSAQLSQQAATAPAAVRSDPAFRERIEELARLRGQIAAYQASVERRTVLGLDTRVAQAGLDAVISRSATARAAVEQIVADAAAATRAFTLAAAPREQRGLGLFGSSVGTESEQAIARARQVSEAFARLPEAAQTGLRGLAGIASNVTDAVQQGTASASQLNAVLDRLGGGISSASIGEGQQELGRRIGNGFLTIITPAEAAADAIEARQQELGRRIGNGFLTIITPAEAAADTLEARVQSLRQRIGNSYLNIIDAADAARDTPAARRAVGASRFLRVNQSESDLLSNEGLRSQIPQNRQGASRLLGGIGGEIDVIRRRLGELPDVAATLGPEVDGLTNRFRTLARTGVGATSQQLQQLRREVSSVSDALNTRGSLADRAEQAFGGRGAAGINLGIDERQLRVLASEVEFLQGRLARVSAEARGPAVAAMERYRQVTVQAFRDGSASTDAGRRRLAEYRAEVVRTSAAAINIRPGRLEDQLRRVGDVARGGFGNAGLAIQQAAFALDDFFSVTGGLDQRIRAAGNNISQLGFIIGGTWGLIAGIVASVGAQGAAALIRWYNEGRTADDTTKALNDSLSRQKTLVEELRSAFASLGDSLTRGLFSDAAQRASEFEEQLSDIAKKQREISDERAVALDPNVIRARADVSVQQRAVESATTPQGFADAQIRLEAARRREREARAAAAAPFTAAQAGDAVRRSLELERAARTDAESGVVARQDTLASRTRRAEQASADAAASRPLEALRIQREELLRRQEELRRPDIAGQVESQQALAVVQDALNKVNAALSRAIDSAANELIGSARGPAVAIEQAQQEVAKAIQAGVPGARLLGVQLDALAGRLKRTLDEIEAASAIEDPIARLEALRPLGSRLSGILAERDSVNRRSDAIRLERTLSPERQIDAVVSRASQQVADLGAPGAALRDQLRRLEFERETIRLQSEQFASDPILARAEEELSERIRALASEIDSLSESVNGFEEREKRRVMGTPERGRELAMTPEQREAEQRAQGVNSIRQWFGEVAAETTGLVDQRAQNEAIIRFFDEQARQAAPMLTGFADEVRNAVLQGPSRAALGATDASTVEGQKELNRLIRGDDPNRDVDLAGLQREANRLLAIIAEKKAAVAN